MDLFSAGFFVVAAAAVTGNLAGVGSGDAAVVAGDLGAVAGIVAGIVAWIVTWVVARIVEHVEATSGSDGSVGLSDGENVHSTSTDAPGKRDGVSGTDLVVGCVVSSVVGEGDSDRSSQNGISDLQSDGVTVVSTTSDGINNRQGTDSRDDHKESSQEGARELH